MTRERVCDLLEMAQSATPPEYLRQHTAIETFLALGAFTAGDYRLAIDFALSALEKSREIRSCPNRDRIAALYEQLLHTDGRNEPQFSYLGGKLRTWDYGMN